MKKFFICGLPNFHRTLFGATVAVLDTVKQIKFVVIANSVAVKQILKENIKVWIGLKLILMPQIFMRVNLLFAKPNA